MGNTLLPIIYVSKEDIISFCKQPEDTVGSSCEWEKERVVHLYKERPLHSYGSIGRVLFTSKDICFVDVCNYDYVIKSISSGNEVSVEVYEYIEGKYTQRSFNYIPSKTDLYSRNKGILEINILEKKRVMIVGLGSFGSKIAIELAKAGVGSFSLMDFDRVELHNLARHTCTINDLGRLKTDAIYDAIVGKNPYAQVDKFPIDINNDLNLLESEIEKSDIVICATDNNQSRFNISEALVKFRKVGIFGRAVTRAEGGDVFRYRPDGPCYSCLIGTGLISAKEEEITDVTSARRAGRIAAYVSEEDADAMVQVGLSADIDPITNLMVKLTLMELSRGKESGISCLEKELVYDYYMWANRRERRHINWSPMPEAGNKPTILRWYGAFINKVEACPICSKKVDIPLDEGDEFESMIGSLSGLEDITLED